MTTDERAGLVDRIPTAPMLLFTIFFTLGVCLIQSYVLLGVGLLLAAASAQEKLSPSKAPEVRHLAMKSKNAGAPSG